MMTMKYKLFILVIQTIKSKIMNDSINSNSLNYLVDKLEHRIRSVNKKKTKYIEQPSIPTNEFILFLIDIEEDLKQSIRSYKKVIK